MATTACWFAHVDTSIKSFITLFLPKFILEYFYQTLVQVWIFLSDEL